MEIEENIREALQTRVTVFKNSPRPVNKLPPEILSRVLENRNAERDLIAATHVCRYWRSSLLSNPTLWTCLRFLYDIDRTSAYLERSKSVPIDIDINLRFKERSGLFELVAPHARRTRSLTIRGTVIPIQALFSRVFYSPASPLQHLKIEVFLGDGDEQTNASCLPDNFLCQHAPTLRSVNFTDLLPTFESHFPFSNLTRFVLFLPWFGDAFRVSALFRVLSNSPRLREVSIHVFTTLIEDTPNSVVSLELLEELEYHGDSGPRVLAWMRLPRLRMLNVVSAAGALANLLPVEGHLLLSKTTRMVWGQASRGIDLRGSEITIQVSSLCEGIDPTDWFSDIPPTSFGQIRDLAYSGFLNPGPPDTAELPITTFENLEVLQFSRCAVWLLEAVSRALFPQDGRGIPCLSLREIRCDSREALESLTWFVEGRRRVGNWLQLVHSSDAETPHG